MKIKLPLFLILLLFIQGFCANLTYYGPSGYAFVPNGFVAYDWKYSGFTGGELVSLQNVRLYPKYLAFRSSFLEEKLELSFSSVGLFVSSDDGYGPQRVANGLLPVIPAIKWNIADKNGDLVRVGYSVGYVFVYGTYFSVTTQIRTPILQPELTLVASLWTERGYGLVGSKLRGADLRGNPLPIAFTAEAGWASSMDLMGKTEESFIAFGSELNLGKNLMLVGNYRRDPSIYYNYDDAGNKESEKKGQNTNGKWSLRLEFHFDGIKSAGGKE
ncbi:MAG: hypothetical protein LBC85_05515 [Fibromonadaceae bacterium]|jgi:hypothetical protein|nr:hypothetical protein [Fibromonadaceae bacterium]